MNNSNNNPSSDESGQANLMQWRGWLADFKRRFIAEQGWDEREAKRQIKDAWAVIRDGGKEGAQ